MAVKVIPLVAGSQKLSTTINGERVSLSIVWRGGAYFMDITNSLGDSAKGLKLTTGCNLLEQFGYMGFTTALVLLGEPTYDNLGTDCQLVSIEP
jgi:hypothetical protein